MRCFEKDILSKDYSFTSVVLCAFSVVLCVKLFSYTELHREGTEFHGVIHLQFGSFLQQQQQTRQYNQQQR